MSGWRGPFVRGALLAVLSFVVVACHETGGAPPASSLEVAPPSADIGENGKSAPSPPESADKKSADVAVSHQEAAAPVAKMPQADDIKSDEPETTDQPPKSTAVVKVEKKEPSPVRPKPEAKPESLIGSQRGDLLARLGAPALLRREPPAELWQFAGDGCVLHVYLYETGSSARYVVTHVELLPRGGLDAVPPGCFGRMLLDGRQNAG